MPREANGDEVAKVKATAAKLASILTRARVRDAATANAQVQQRSARIERARQARVRRQQGR